MLAVAFVGSFLGLATAWIAYVLINGPRTCSLPAGLSGSDTCKHPSFLPYVLVGVGAGVVAALSCLVRVGKPDRPD